MTGQKGSTWSKPKVIKKKVCIQLIPDNYNKVDKISKKKFWSIAQTVVKIFEHGLKTFRG